MKAKSLLVVTTAFILLSTNSFAQNINPQPTDLQQATKEKLIKSTTITYLKNIDEPLHALESSWLRLFTAPTTLTSTEITYILTSASVTIGSFFVFYKIIKSIFTKKTAVFEKKSAAIEHLLARNLLTYEEATRFLFKNTITHNLHTILWSNKDSPYVKFLIDCKPDIMSNNPSQASNIITHHAHQD